MLIEVEVLDVDTEVLVLVELVEIELLVLEVEVVNDWVVEVDVLLVEKLVLVD